MTFLTSGPYEKEALAAREEFFHVMGVLDESSVYAETKMAQFVDWYLFQRPMKGRLAVEEALEHMEISETERPFFEALKNTKHSLFELLKVKGQDLVLKDLFSDYKFSIKNSHIAYGFEKEELFETRLVPHEDTFVFLNSFCFHPPEAKKYILSEVKKVKKIKDEQEASRARENLMWKLLIMRNKLEQYNHLGIPQIYNNDSKILRSVLAKEK
ncbi:MAG: hypothetical protein D6797_00485 [Bdellovibrio sp.]|nr:MAG: hypothetical protein D6797_00485 [Bdellovibrio sp.]